MYSKLPNLVIGFHGCSKEAFQKIIYDHQPMLPSIKDYDWLGHGIYFWEGNLDRAWQWARERRADSPAVVAAIMDLGLCLNLVDSKCISEVQLAHQEMESQFKIANQALPINSNTKDSKDFIVRRLDCAVIQFLHNQRENNKQQGYDSVRGFFTEGNAIYENSGFYYKSHIQICIRNPNCIKGVFVPRECNQNNIIP